MSNRRVLQAPTQRQRPTQKPKWGIWEWLFGGGYYNG